MDSLQEGGCGPPLPHVSIPLFDLFLTILIKSLDPVQRTLREAKINDVHMKMIEYKKVEHASRIRPHVCPSKVMILY